MNDFLLNIFKGMYPLYFIFLIFGIVHRIISRKWNAFDSLLLISFLIFEFFAAFQVPFFYGILSTSKRYLWIGLPLCLPFVSEGFIGFFKMLSRRKYQKPVVAVLIILVIGINIYNIYFPIFHERHSSKKIEERRLSYEIAEWIENDWKKCHSNSITVFKCDQYQSGKRPLVQSDWERIGWLCGGQSYLSFLAAEDIMPDYIVSESQTEIAGYKLVKTFDDSVCVYVQNRMP